MPGGERPNRDARHTLRNGPSAGAQLGPVQFVSCRGPAPLQNSPLRPPFLSKPAGSRWRVFATNRRYLRLRPCLAGQGDGQARRVSFTTHRAPGRLVGSTFMIRYF